MKRIVKICLVFILAFTIAEDIICQSFTANYFDQEGREYKFAVNPAIGFLFSYDAGEFPLEYKPIKWVMTEYGGTMIAKDREQQYAITWDVERLTITSPELGTTELYHEPPVIVGQLKFPIFATDPEFGYTVKVDSEWYQMYCPGEPAHCSGELDHVSRTTEGTTFGTDSYGDIIICISPEGIANCTACQ